MRTAILISGQIRNAKDTYESIKKNLIDVYDADVFISTWTNSDKIAKSVLAGGSKGDDSTLDELIQMYKPKRIEVEEYNDELIQSIQKLYKNKNSSIPIETKPLSVFMMWYKTAKVNSLRKEYEKRNKFEYDVVIKTRFDLAVDEPLPIIDANSYRNNIWIPKGWDWKNGMNDLFALGNGNVMDYYCSMFSELPYFLDEGHLFHPEYLMKVHIDRGAMQLNRPKWELSLRGIKIHSKEAND